MMDPRPLSAEAERSRRDQPSSLKARLIAFYLPQFHPIPENDAWWGKGFTEWTNVAKARPLFRGHYQPHLPADLGFYDLRVPETRIAQAEMARKYGIEAFCYWHYWFAGRRLLERPFNEVLRSGQPNFPFCLAWANETWSGIWYGRSDRILVEQTYPGLDDYRAHFYALLDAFGDDRYAKIEGKPIFLVFRPANLPESWQFTDCWRELAQRAGLKGIYFVGLASPTWCPEEHGFDASVVDSVRLAVSRLGYSPGPRRDKVAAALQRIGATFLCAPACDRPRAYSYRKALSYALPDLGISDQRYPCVVPNWDNTPRSGLGGVAFEGSSPDLFAGHLRGAIGQVAHRLLDQRVVFVRSWNEWAEGNHLEPDQKFGHAYLEVVRREVFGEVAQCRG